jgi:regulator of protease activity HflC (stomatin/prohibitin superfamily)
MTNNRLNTKQQGWLLGSLLGTVVLAAMACWLAVEWGYNRIYIEEGESLFLRYKGPPLPFLPGSREPASPGHFAEVDDAGNPLQLGILEQMRGPGRHFYCPLWWETRRVPDQVVEPGEVAVVTSKMGKPLTSGQFLVDGNLGTTEHKGILRNVFGPGRYRVNTYAYEFKKIKSEQISSGNQTKHAGWVDIPTGYVGVVTNLTDNPITGEKAGIQNSVLPPGLYPINPKEQQIDIVEIGYREISIIANLMTDQTEHLILDESGEPILADDESGITFPSNDAYQINMDFTAIWGIMPDQAPDAIKRFGNVDAVELKVVVPQIESICRNNGSKLGAVELLEGESRQKFQDATKEEFKKVLAAKGITLLEGVVRHIYIPQEIRLPIQNAYIADERKLALRQKQLTTKTEANLKEATAQVELESEKVRVDTARQVAKRLAEGEKMAQETMAETLQLAAAIDKDTAEIEAQANVVLGEAEAKARQLSEEAKADKFRLAVEAFGSGSAYNQWVFATGLPDDVRLKLLYAGEGTFWTDLKGFSETLLGRQAQQEQKKEVRSEK